MPLCRPGGGRPAGDSKHYIYKGRCTPMEVLEKTNSWTPSAGDSTPAGSERMVAERTKLGIVAGRGNVKGRRVAFTKLRATYFHEADSALGFVDLNNPDAIRGPRDFQRAASKIGFTFNWFYADNKDIAYFNSGNNPLRPKGISTHFPVASKYEWRGLDPNLNMARYTRFSAHPQAINQAFFTNWNNKQAKGYRAADDNFSYGSFYRSSSLSDRIRRGIKGRRKMSLVQLIDAMEDAGTVDLRAVRVLPYALRVLRNPRDPQIRAAVNKLRAWVRAGGHRRDRNRDFVYEHTEAIRILDAWWPHLLDYQFKPTMGTPLFRSLRELIRQDDDPNLDGAHLGSAYNGGWYHYSQKDLRTVLGVHAAARRRARARSRRPPAFTGSHRLRGLRGPPARNNRYSRIYCGGSKRRSGNLRTCRKRLAASLGKALGADTTKLYEDEVCEDYERPSDQWCFDTVRQRPAGAVTQQLIHWINRPTFQQAVEVQRRAPR